MNKFGGKNHLGADRPDVISKQDYLTELSRAEHHNFSVWLVWAPTSLHFGFYCQIRH